MNTNSWQKFRKIETTLLSVLLYGIVLLYTYQYLKIANKNGLFGEDQRFYYMEAKSVAAYNIYHAPLSLDGNTSIIGNFGTHGISYALVDGWLAKLFFHAQDPPLVLINFLTTMILLLLILLFKPFDFNIRLKIALLVATHHILYSMTFSYAQETIHIFFAVLALRILYVAYQQPNNNYRNNYIYYYLILIIIAITFRYSWAVWGVGLLPFAKKFKDFGKYLILIIGLLCFGIFIAHYTCAPYPYTGDYQNVLNEKISLNSLLFLWKNFTQNLHTLLVPNESLSNTCFHYIFLFLLLINSWYAIVKRNKYTIACVLIAWGYFLALVVFYYVGPSMSSDTRLLAVLNPLLIFSLIGGNYNSFIFYPFLALQLWFLPNNDQNKHMYEDCKIYDNVYTDERISRDNGYSKIKDLITDDEDVTVEISYQFVFYVPNYFQDFPLATSKGHAIHYRMYMNGNDLRKVHHTRYLCAVEKVENGAYEYMFPIAKCQLLYADRWMHFYKILD
jgi:hypothetical protein